MKTATSILVALLAAGCATSAMTPEERQARALQMIAAGQLLQASQPKPPLVINCLGCR